MAGQALAARARREHAAQSYAHARAAVLTRLESSVREPGDRGLAADFGRYRQAWSDVANNPGHGPALAQVLARARALTLTVAGYADAVAAQCAALMSQAHTSVTELNAIAERLAGRNAAIAEAVPGAADPLDDSDPHDAIAMRSAELAGAQVDIDVLGRAQMSLDGVVLVAGGTAGHIDIAQGDAACSGDRPLSLVLRGPQGAGIRSIQASAGRLGAIAELCNTTLPEFLAQLAAVTRLFADSANAAHVRGFDAHGDGGAALFSYDPADVLGTLAVAVTDPTPLATSALPDGLYDGGNALRMAAGNPAEAEYHRMVGSLGTQALTAERQKAHQRSLTNQVDSCRAECTGRATVDQLAVLRGHQRAYSAAAVVLVSVEAMFDTLIEGGGAPMVPPGRGGGNVSRRPVASVRTGLRRLAPTRERLATGRVLNRPSDSPVGIVVAMRLRARLAEQEQHLRNGFDGARWLRRSRGSLGAALACLRLARALLPTGALSPSLSAQARELLAEQVRQCRADLLLIANTTRHGRPLFGGITTGARAFDPTGTFVGMAGHVGRVVADGLIVPVNVDGQSAFAAPGAGVFADLDRLASALCDGDAAATAVAMLALDTAMTRLRRMSAEVEASARSIDEAVDAARDTIRDLTTSLAELESIDLSRARAELQVRDSAHAAALAAIARVAQPSLAAILR